MSGFFIKLFKSIAVIKKKSAIEKKHITVLDFNKFADHIRQNISGINKNNLSIAVNKIRSNAASEGIPKNYKFLISFRGLIFDCQQGF